MSKTGTKDFEKRKAIVARLRPIDDAFFEVIMQDKEVCQEVLRVILQDEKLTVEEVVPQKSIKNLQGRSVRLDAYCILGSGEHVNVEVQKENVDNHPKRIRYNAACVTANITDPGENFENIPEVYIVYISQFDMFKKGKTIYHGEMYIRETGEYVDDGLHEIYVNTKIDDGSNIAELMKCFEQENIKNVSFPKLSERVTELKDGKKEVEKMCSLIEDYAKDYAKEYAEEVKNESIKQIAIALIHSGDTDEKIHTVTKLSMERIAELRGKEMFAV